MKYFYCIDMQTQLWNNTNWIQQYYSLGWEVNIYKAEMEDKIFMLQLSTLELD